MNMLFGGSSVQAKAILRIVITSNHFVLSVNLVFQKLYFCEVNLMLALSNEAIYYLKNLYLLFFEKLFLLFDEKKVRNSLKK